jgi:hypothetical protein
MAYLKWQQIAKIVGATGAASALLIFFLITQLAAMSYNIPDDINCGSECFSEVQLNTSYWRICFENNGADSEIIRKKVTYGRTLWINLDRISDVIPTVPEIEAYMLVPTNRINLTVYQDDDGRRWRHIQAGDCFERYEKPNYIGIYGKKPVNLTVKWSMIFGMFFEEYINIDPVWNGIEQSAEIVDGREIVRFDKYEMVSDTSARCTWIPNTQDRICTAVIEVENTGSSSLLRKLDSVFTREVKNMNISYSTDYKTYTEKIENDSCSEWKEQFTNEDKEFLTDCYYEVERRAFTNWKEGLPKNIAEGVTAIKLEFMDTLKSENGIGIINNFNLSVGDMLLDPEIGPCAMISSPGVYVLNGSYSGISTTNCIDINSSDVILDCGSYMLDSNDAADRGINIQDMNPDISNITVKNCYLRNWDTTALYSVNSVLLTVDNVTFDSNPDHNLYTRQCNNCLYKDLKILSGSTNVLDYGVYLYYPLGTAEVYNVTIGETHNTANGINIELGVGTYVKIEDCILDGPEQWPVYMNIDSDCELVYLDNVTSENYPIYIYNSTTNPGVLEDIITKELILCNAEGIVVDNATIGVGNIVSGGILMINTDDATIINSTINKTENGILFRSPSSTNLTITNNVFEATQSDAFFILTQVSSSSEPSEFYNNTFYNIGDAAIVIGADTDNLKIHDNTFKDINGPVLEITVSYADNNEFYNNYIYDNTAFGVGLIDVFDADSCSFNTTEQTGTRIHDEGEIPAPNIGGNYWDNSTGGYSGTCVDSDKDGFCDVSAQVGAEVWETDYLPYSDQYIMEEEVDCDIDCSDDDITEPLDCEGGDLTFTGTGEIVISATISNFANVKYLGTSCRVIYDCGGTQCLK